MGGGGDTGGTRVQRQPAESEKPVETEPQAPLRPPAGPFMQMNLIRRATAETEGESPVASGVTSEASGAASQDESDQPDIDELADKVYRRLRERLRLERERFGAFRYR